MNYTIAIPRNNQYDILNGLAATLSLIPGINVIYWIPEQKPIFDLLDETRPQILFCTSQMLTPIFIKAIQEYNVDVIVLGPTSLDINNIKLVILPYQLPEKIINNAVESLEYQSYIWKRAANVAQYKNCKYNEVYASDILYISDIDIANKPYIYNILLDIIGEQKYKVKICGTFRMPLNEYIGVPNLQEICTLMGSAKIVLDFDNTTIYDCAIGRAFCLSNIQQDICPYYANNTNDLLKQIEHFIEDDKHRNHYIKRAYKLVQNETYLNRIYDIFKQINNEDISQKIMEYQTNINGTL